MIDCLPGQRWISGTEPELGLGIVYEIENRRVVLNFPASDERRTYATDNAPLTRVIYRPADRVRAEDGTEIIVSRIAEADGCLVYHGIDARGQELSLHEIDLDSFVQFSRPLDRLFTGQIDKSGRFQVRSETLVHRHEHQSSAAFGLVGPRVQLLPHQFYIADEVARRHAPRVLLADEVGLGKTIEAGLVMHQHIASGRAERILVITPANLVHQWLVEMLRRFNLHFSILDANLCEELESSGETNPFETAQLVLTSLDFLSRDAPRCEQACQAGWDLLVVDEAHHLHWTPDGASPEYASVERLSAHAPGLLLLTATPEQLGQAGHFARLRLLDSDRYHDLDRFLAEEQRYAEVSALVERLDAAAAPDDATLADIAAYVGGSRLDALRADADAPGSDTFSQRLVRELLDHHGTGRVLFRNCRENIAGFPERRLHVYELEAPAVYREAPAAGSLTPEAALDDGWLSLDPRVEWLATLLARHRSDKTLVICALSDTAQTLEAYLRARKGVRSTAFHEDMDLVQRDRAAAYFADLEDDAQVLVCSEIGSEGRNFQFARHLVLFDLPPNPDLLEQRIGRLDRIGQQHAVEIHVPYFAGSAQAVLLRWLHEGIDAFEHICPAGSALYAEFADALGACMADPKDAARHDELVTRTRARASELAGILARGRDRLLELNSFDKTRAARVLAAVKEAERAPQLADWLDRVFDEFGVEHEDNGEMSLVLQPGDHMVCHAFPGLPEGGLTVTFDRDRALTRDDMQFLSWEHPLATGAADMVLGGEFGNASFGIVRTPALEAGTVAVEGLFVIVCPAPRGMRVERFLPHSSLRIVVDAAGRDLTAGLGAEWLNTNVRDVPTGTAMKVVAKTRDVIEGIADHAAHFAEVQQEGLINDAVAAMNAELRHEIERLKRLAEVNPNVREAEILHLTGLRERLEQYLRGAQLKLDAVRVVVAT